MGYKCEGGCYVYKTIDGKKRRVAKIHEGASVMVAVEVREVTYVHGHMKGEHFHQTDTSQGTETVREAMMCQKRAVKFGEPKSLGHANRRNVGPRPQRQGREHSDD